MKRVHLFISGRVQGVGFRYAVEEKASALGINGWVRNLFDGRVEAIGEGENKLINEFVDFCRCGPCGAIVKDLIIEEETPVQNVKGFEIR